MPPKLALSQALQITCVDDEVVFLGDGAVNFAMTRTAARKTLDALSAALESDPADRQLGPTPSLRSRVILLVDDEPMIRAWGTMILEDAGYSVIEARDAMEALATLRNGVEVHLVFTDVQMPGQLDGLQLARKVTEHWPTIAVLICSGQVQPDHSMMPATGRFIQKPYQAEEMLQHVRELVAS